MRKASGRLIGHLLVFSFVMMIFFRGSLSQADLSPAAQLLEQELFGGMSETKKSPAPAPAPAPAPVKTSPPPASTSPQEEEQLTYEEEASFHESDEQKVPSDLTNYYIEVIQQTLDITRRVDPGCFDCGFVMRGEAAPPSECRAAYDRLYSEDRTDDVLDIRMTIGYMDYIRDVEDKYILAAFEDQITVPCQRGVAVCGFQRDPDNAEIFIKRVMAPSGKAKTVQLRVVNSSATTNETLNRGAEKSAQAQKTAKAKRHFHKSLTEADVAIYVGHARGGGGPSFEPPVIHPQTRRTDFSWYRRTKHSESEMLETLRSSEKKAPIIGIFACNARKLFGPEIHSVAPKSGLALSGRDSTFESSMAQAVALVDSVLALRCEDATNKSVQAIRKVGDFRISPVKFEGFFRPLTRTEISTPLE